MAITEWVEFMSNIFNTEKLNFSNNLELESFLEGYDESIICNPISDVEIEYAVKGLKNNKSPGPGLITNENIKVLLPLMLPPATV
jgi:hypothetical protein